MWEFHCMCVTHLNCGCTVSDYYCHIMISETHNISYQLSSHIKFCCHYPINSLLPQHTYGVPQQTQLFAGISCDLSYHNKQNQNKRSYVLGKSAYARICKFMEIALWDCYTKMWHWNYCIVENFGGKKHWRIWRSKQRFVKVLPNKFYQNVFEVKRLLAHITDLRECTFFTATAHGSWLFPNSRWQLSSPTAGTPHINWYSW